jgi:hypothetical protein
MDEATFQRELSRYKVVRRDDHHKVRWNKRELSKITGGGEAPATTQTITTASNGKKTGVETSPPSVSQHGMWIILLCIYTCIACVPHAWCVCCLDSFWSALEASAKDILTDAESKAFLTAVRAVRSAVQYLNDNI